METTEQSKEEIGRLGKKLYEQNLRAKVETAGNIGKMVIIDVETGDYGVDDTGLEAARRLHSVRPNAPLYGIRIGYNVSAAMGGVMERIA